MSEQGNESLTRALRAVKAQALREAADAIESCWEGIEESGQQFTPGHAARQLRARAKDLEDGKRS
jgi:hypothetical protein